MSRSVTTTARSYSRRFDLKDCSRTFLEEMERVLTEDVAAGNLHLQARLDAVRAQIPHAPPYEIEYRVDR